MSEIQEFEAINQKTSARNSYARAMCHDNEESLREKKQRLQKKAILRMVAVAVALVVSILGFTALEEIGWINGSFRVVLMYLAGSVAMFGQGYFWHEIKS